MCNVTGIQFGVSHLSQSEVYNKKVIEVGARDVNGSLRADIERLKPLSYLGVDIVEGKGVDTICDVYNLTHRFGKESFDIVISTELIEHVRDWNNAISNLKNILKPNGILILTTRSKGCGYHGYPFDFWRYEKEDMKILFSDFKIEVIESDTLSPGVFIKVIKPEVFTENNLENHQLFSIVKERRCKDISEFDIFIFKIKLSTILFLKRVLPEKVKKVIRKVVLKEK